MAGTVSELICIVPGKEMCPVIVTNVWARGSASEMTYTVSGGALNSAQPQPWARGLPVFIAVWRLQKNYRTLELKHKARAFLSSSKLELFEYSEQPSNTSNTGAPRTQSHVRDGSLYGYRCYRNRFVSLF